MEKLYQAHDQVEAQLLKDYLASYHIETVVQGEYLVGAAGELPALQFPVLWVMDERDLTRGRQLIDQFQRQSCSDTAWVCRRCSEDNEGQFQLCWKCGGDRS